MLLDWVGFLIIAAGPGLLLLWGIVALFIPFGPKPASREKLVKSMAACRDALKLEGDPASKLLAIEDGQTINISLEDAEKTNLPDLVVSATHLHTGLNSQLPLSIDRIRPIALRRETSEDKFGKLLFINREPQTGDEAFDAEVYVETTAPFDLASEALSNSRVRKNVLHLLEDGWTRVVLYGHDLVRLEQVPTTESSFDPARISRAMGLVSGLTRSLAPIVAEKREVARPSLHRKILSGLFVAAWMLGAALTIAGVRMWSPLTLTPYIVCAAAAFVLFLVNIPVLALLVRGHSDSLHAMYKLLVLQMVAVLPFCTGIGTVANGLLDNAPGQVRTVRVVAVRSASESSRLGGRYAEIESWIDGEGTSFVPVSESVYSEFKSNNATHASVLVGQGALGWPWCVNVGVEPKVP